MIDVLRAQLLALRTQVDAMLAVMDACAPILSAEPSSQADTGCPHLETENIGTFGAPAFKCLACGQMVEQPVPG